SSEIKTGGEIKISPFSQICRASSGARNSPSVNSPKVCGSCRRGHLAIKNLVLKRSGENLGVVQKPVYSKSAASIVKPQLSRISANENLPDTRSSRREARCPLVILSAPRTSSTPTSSK